ncbi:MAG: hypothetical protein Q4F21_14850 [Lachnospiraceae bacterium]|nr:hypothetical protein [Lachnospiraceae bacterium]
MKTVFKHNPSIPYSLHDMRVSEIKIIEDSIVFIFEHGYVKCAEPYKQVEGTVTIEGVNFDFADVRLNSRNGAYGKFQGEKLELSQFLERYDWAGFEVVDELYGYNQVVYSGYLSIAETDDLIETDISIYFTGNIIYKTEE